MGNATLSSNNLKTKFEQDIVKRGETIHGRELASWTPQEKKARFMNWEAPIDTDIGALRHAEQTQKQRRGGLLSVIFGLLFGTIFNRQKEQVKFE